MCGIAGLIQPTGGVDTGALANLSRALLHRGPDDMGYAGWRAGDPVRVGQGPAVAEGSSVGFAHRRLSIIDETDAGRQPMATQDGRYVIVFNGEIYNYLELRDELKALGHTFRSTSDTEVLLAAYAEWGVDVLPRLTGMFAFAILDTQTSDLFLARDPFGIKPLYYADHAGGLAFASEIPALLSLPGLSRRAEPGALYDYLRFGFTDRGARTMFDGIKSLPAAHWALVDLTQPTPTITPRRYWQVATDRTLDISFEDAATHLRDLFAASVGLHLRSDVAVGAALSGGIDSSAVVMAMREIQGSSLNIHTFSFIADDPRMNEERWVDLVGGEAAATVHKVHITPGEMAADLDDLIACQGEPFGTTSIYAQHRVFRRVREAGIKVTLDGQGADEMLAGYPTFYASRILSLLRAGRVGDARQLLFRAAATGNLSAVSIALRAGGQMLPRPLENLARRLVGQDLTPNWMATDWFTDRGVVPEGQPRNTGKHALKSHLHHTLTDYTLPSLLRYADRNSMAHSVESRVPFLTPKIAEFLFSLPEDHLIDANGTTKSVFRAAMRGVVPDAVLDRPDKIGFVTPQAGWLNSVSGWVDDVLASDEAANIPALDRAAIDKQWQAVKAGKRPFTSEIWRWINLIRWAGTHQVEFS